jgi:hypothetical protein
MKTLTLAAIRCSLMLTAVTGSLVFVQPAQAYTVTMEQVGANVVAHGSGAFNLMGLTFDGLGGDGVPAVQANFALIQIGKAPHPGVGTLDTYVGFTGPTNFGVGTAFVADFGSGDFISLIAGGRSCRPFCASGLCLGCCSIGWHDL